MNCLHPPLFLTQAPTAISKTRRCLAASKTHSRERASSLSRGCILVVNMRGNRGRGNRANTTARAKRLKPEVANGERYYGGRVASKKKALKRVGGDGENNGDLTFSRKKSLKAVWLHQDQVFTVREVLTDDEAQQMVAAGEHLGFSLETSRGPRYGEAVREHGRIAVEDASMAQRLWETGLDKVFRDLEVDGKRAVGLNPMIRLYKYAPGNVFSAHYDQSMIVADKKTEYTLLVYLTGDLQGGQTVFYDHKERVVAAVEPQPGMALLHRHGDLCLLHEARPVSKGTKYVLRSDVVFC